MKTFGLGLFIGFGLLTGCLLVFSLAAQQKSTHAGVQSALIPINDAAHGKLITSHKGKVVLVSFWATWCVPCRKEMPDLVKMTHKLSARGFELVMISADEPESEVSALKVLKDNAAPGAPYVLHSADREKFYLSVDSKWADGALPALFLYDRTGKKARAFIGETSVNDLESAIAKLL